MSSSNPFGRFLGRLSVGRKLALIYLLDLTAVIYVSSILINEKFIGIDFARKELAGNTSIVGVREALVGATLAANDPASSAVAGAAAARRLQQMEVNYGSGMQSADLNAGLSAKLDQLARTPTIDRSTAVSAVLATGRDLLTRIGNQSNLILDPDLDSYYTMSLIVLRYPELLEIIDNIGRPVATPATSALEVSEARTRYLILEGKIDATMQGIASDYSEAVAASGKGLKTSLNPIRQRLEASAERFRQEACTAIIASATPQGVATVQQASNIVVGDLQASWSVAGDALAVLLKQRISSGGTPALLWQVVSARGSWQGELSVRRRDGTEYPAWLMVSAVRQSNGEISHYIFTSIDISDRKNSETRIRFLAEHDVLTELPNRSLCTERLRLAVQQVERSGQKVAVLFIDLDHFKDINDSLGHHVGDGLLRSIAQRLLDGAHDLEEVTDIVKQRLIPSI